MAKRAALKLDELKANKPGVEPLKEIPAAPPAAAGERRRGQTLRLPEHAWRQLKYLAVDQGRPAHELLVEAVNDMFQKFGKPPIA